MDAILEQINSTGNAFVDFSLPMLVQSSVLIVVLLGLDLILRKRIRAVFRYWIWMIVLVKLVLPTTLSLPTSPAYWFSDEPREVAPEQLFHAEKYEVISPHANVPIAPSTSTTLQPAPVSSGQADIVAAPAMPVSSIGWQGFVFLAWLAAVLIMTALLIQRTLFVRRLITQSDKASDGTADILGRACEQMGASKGIALRLSPVAASPSVCGLLRPTILIPKGLAGAVNVQHLKSILLHELAHIKRGDLWVSLIQTIVQIIYIYSPLLWVANAIIRKVREQAVDEMVLVAMGEQAEDYPKTLVSISKLTFGRPVLSLRLIGVAESKKALIGRIKHITSRPFPRSAKMGICGFSVVLILGAALLPMAKARRSDKSNIPVVSDREEESTKSLRQAVVDGDIHQVESHDSKGIDVKAEDASSRITPHRAASRDVKGVVAPTVMRASDAKSKLESIERGVQLAYETVRPGVVGIARLADRERPIGSGVIVTADGHVVTGAACARDTDQGDSLAIYLAGGRRVTGAALGWSEEWGLGLVKITEKGPWPHVKLDEMPDIKAGRLCVALGYTRLIDNQFERQPALRLGCVTKSAAPIWFSSSVVDVRGSFKSIFDLEGRLAGLTTRQWSGEDAVHTRTELIKMHWDDLVAGKNLGRVRLLSSEENAAGKSPRTIGPKPEDTTETEEEHVSAEIKNAEQATVRIRRPSDGYEEGWSGVIVTSDGYITTCAHSGWQLPGEKVTISLPDGRDVAGKVLGTNWICDICLVKITEEGPWPHVELGNSAMMRPDDTCLIMGYPVTHRDRQPWVRRARIVQPQDDSSSDFLFTSLGAEQYRGEYTGVSGGGIFDMRGRVVAVPQNVPSSGLAGRRIELFREQWDFLAVGKPVDVISTEPLSEINAAFGRVANDLPPIVVEVLGDNKQRALGTIVRSYGRILTKASELYGALSCRFADGRILPATVEEMSREHDLAILKVNASNLPEADLSPSDRTPVGALIAALTPTGPPAVGVVSNTTRPIPRESGYLEIGEVRGSDRGLEVHDDSRPRWLDLPVRKGDIIVHVEGRLTPDLKTYRELIKLEVDYRTTYPGDPIRVGVKRGDDMLDFRFPLVPGWAPYPKDQSIRCSAFPSAFDTHLPLTLKMCGGPVIDKTGRIAGVAIARRGSYGATAGGIHVIPAAVAGKVADKLMDGVSEVNAE